MKIAMLGFLLAFPALAAPLESKTDALGNLMLSAGCAGDQVESPIGISGASQRIPSIPEGEKIATGHGEPRRRCQTPTPAQAALSGTKLKTPSHSSARHGCSASLTPIETVVPSCTMAPPAGL